METEYAVYILETPDGKRYVGCTKQPLVKRWQKGNGYKQNKAFYKEIEKCGWKSIKKTVISEHMTESEASSLERKLIERFSTYNPLYGFNRSHGGEIRKKKSLAIIPNKIKMLRKKNKLTQVELAEKARVKQSTIQAYESGRAKPMINTAIQLAKALDVEVDDLMNDERSVDSVKPERKGAESN